MESAALKPSGGPANDVDELAIAKNAITVAIVRDAFVRNAMKRLGMFIRGLLMNANGIVGALWNMFEPKQ